ELVRFEPEQRAVAVGPVMLVGDGAVVVLDIDAVQLEEQAAVAHEPLVLAPAVRALAAQEPLVPAAARLDVSHRDQGLGSHLSLQRNGSRTVRTPCKWRCGRAGTVARPLDPRPTPPAQAGQGGDHVPHLLAPGAAPTSARAPGPGAASA